MKYLKRFESNKYVEKIFYKFLDQINAGNPENTKKMIDTYPELLNRHDNENSGGWTPLMWAVNANTDKNLEVVRVLIDAGANINEVDNFGWTALVHIAANEVGHQIEILKLLLDSGADPYIKDFPPDEDEKNSVNYKGGEDFYDHAQVWVEEWVQKNLPEFWKNKKQELAQKRFDL